MPQVLFLTQSDDTLPSVRFRVLPYLKRAEEDGLEALRLRAPKTFFGRMVFYARLPSAESIVIQKRLPGNWEIALIRRRCRRLVYDFDDAVWASHPNARRPGCEAGEKRNLERLLEVCRRSDLVVAGNEYLAGKVGEAAEKVAVLPTPIDTETYKPGPAGAGRSGRPVVGWMGASCNLFFLPDVLDALESLRDVAEFRVISDEPAGLEEKPAVRFLRWSPEKELEQLRAMDVGLMPLTDDEYTRGKCGFKLLQYMACGVVPVASDVGFNREIVEHGETGFLASSPEDFTPYVRRLLDDEGLRKDMARAARRSVVERFSLEAAWKRLKGLLGLEGA
jgi:glycosyltransferase involved in cell wall biosynthesis